jgi:lipopolysaccharide transport system permease protein
MEHRRIITSAPDTLQEYLSKIWQSRSLVLILAKRDLKIKYAQTILGLAWTIVQPLTAVVVFSLFFSVILDFKAPYPYVSFVLSGLLIWGLFNYIFSQGSSSLIQNQDLIRKMNFPKIVLPLSKVLLALVEFGITFILLVIVMLVMQQDIFWSMLLLPLVVIPVILFSFGMALILSAFTVKNRDLFHIIPFLVNFGIWFTPVFYPVTIIPGQYAEYKNIIFINPMAAGIQLFRWSFFGEPLNGFVFLGIFICFIIFIVGLAVFRRAEDKIIDLI